MLMFAAPIWLWGLLSLPVIIALHVMQRARRERVVNALWLWSGEQAQRRRARFLPTLLLLLQLLAAASMVFAAAGPRLETLGRDLVVVLDAGAAMRAVDVAPSRFEVARQEVLKLLDGARRAVVVRAGLAPVALTGTLDEVRRRVAELEAADAQVDLPAALGLARELLPQAELHLVTGADPPPGFAGVLHQVRGDGNNVGIVAFQIRGQQAFVAIEANIALVEVDLRLEREGQTVAQTRLRLAADGRAVWTPQVGAVGSWYRVVLEPSRLKALGDALTLDDEAFAVTRPTGRVLVSPPQEDVLRAVASVPGVRVSVAQVPPISSRGFDVLVLVGAWPRALPSGRYLIFAPQVTNARPAQLEMVDSWDATAPLLRFVDLSGIRVRVSSLGLPKVASSWQVLARVGREPFILETVDATADVQAVVFRAHPLDSDLRQSPAFPLIIFHALSDLLAARVLPLGARLPQGDVRLMGESTGPFAHVPGVYSVRDSGRTYSVVANLFSSAMTHLPKGTVSERIIQSQLASPLALAQSAPIRAPLLYLAAFALAIEYVLRALGTGFVWRRPTVRSSR